MPNGEPVLIPDIKMKYFALQSLIPNYPSKMRLSPIMQLLILTSKLVLLMEPIIVNMQIVTKTIHIIHIVIKIYIEMNLNTTL